MYGKIIDGHKLLKCQRCGMVIASAVSKFEPDYSDYGDYLITSREKVRNLLRMAYGSNHHLFREIQLKYGQKARILDFGCGAGYFVKAAADFGFDSYGVEASDKLIAFSKKTFGLKKVFKDIDSVGKRFDVICMFDVIEHLDPLTSRNTMEQILGYLNNGGMLLGNTPNYESANILISKDKDPVIAPPFHACYFTSNLLDRYFRSFSLRKIMLHTKGFSTNSFFRPSKNKASFLEQPSHQNSKLLAHLCAAINTAFGLASSVVSPIGLGYQIYFRYAKR